MQHFGHRTNKEEKSCCRWKENIKINPEDGRFSFAFIFSASIEVYYG